MIRMVSDKSARHAPFARRQRFNLDHDMVLTIIRMEMRRNMVVVVHADGNSKELAQCGPNSILAALWYLTKPFQPPNWWHPFVALFRARVSFAGRRPRRAGAVKPPVIVAVKVHRDPEQGTQLVSLTPATGSTRVLACLEAGEVFPAG